EAPGFGTYGQVGAPALPALRADLAIVTSAQDATLASFSATDLRTVPKVLVWPQPLWELDQSAGGVAPGSRPETFQLDRAIYGMAAPWRPTPGQGLHPRRPKLGSLEGSTVQLTPVRWNPADGSLVVPVKAQYVFTHDGAVRQLDPITKDRAHDASDA